jgi:hypothetical protein
MTKSLPTCVTAQLRTPCGLFGWPIAIDASDSVDEPGVTESAEKFYGGVIYQTPQGTLFGLRPVGDTGFHSTRTGLDHVSFAVANRPSRIGSGVRLRPRFPVRHSFRCREPRTPGAR